MGQSFRDLIVWQRAIQLTIDIYKLTAQFPAAERFGLTSQMRRAAVSIPSNISEGYGRASKGEYVQFVGHARGSCSELETQIVIAKALGFGTPSNLDSAEGLCKEVGRLLGALMKSLRPNHPQSLSHQVPRSLNPPASSPSVPKSPSPSAPLERP
jgi:four helix bundle protein